MVKILLDNDVKRWLYITECPCNDAFFRIFSFDSLSTITKVITLANIHDHVADPYDPKLLSEVFSERVSVYYGAIETKQYANATAHENNCVVEDTEV